MYKTQWGVKFIDYIGEKYQKALNFFSYISISVGYVLMAGMLFMVFQTVWLYLTTSISQVVKVPPVAPLIPYFPKLFGLQSLFPPFYFVYFIVAILIVATVHEFAHGIFARKAKIKIKSTGFAFFKYFPAFFGAFVEQDDEQMKKVKKFEQMSVLSAGVFANVLTAILFYVILFGFFTLTFVASGVVFNTYAYSVVDTSEVISVNGVLVEDYKGLLDSANETGLNKIKTKEGNYVATREVLEEQEENQVILLYYDAPAINSEIGIISAINGVNVDSLEKLQEELEKYSAGEEVEIESIEEGEVFVKKVVLEEHPEKEGVAWLGIGFAGSEQRILTRVLEWVPSYKEKYVYYEPKNDLSVFVKDFLWWVFVINVLVGFFNMLPVGILDGGRFFYLTVLGLTSSKKVAKRSFKIMNQLILLALIAIMIKWVFGFF